MRAERGGAETQPRDRERERGAGSPWRMPLGAWKKVLGRTWQEAGEDQIALIAAGVAFYGFLALVPMLGAVVLAYGLFAEPSDLARHFATLTSLLPANAARLIAKILAHAMETSADKKGFGLVAALALALFGARNGAGSLIKALTIAYEQKETRGFLQVTLLALAMTAVGAVAAIIAAAAMALLADVRALLPELPGWLLAIIRVFFYILAGFAAAGAAAAVYHFAPARREPHWVWLTPGSVIAGAGGLLLTLGFGLYVRTFGRYDAAYGSLGGVVALLTWLYLSSYVLLLGAELNAELEQQTGKAPEPPDATPPPAAEPAASRHDDRAEEAEKPLVTRPAEEEDRGAQPERQVSDSSAFSKPLAIVAAAGAGIFLLRRLISANRAHQDSA